MDDAQDECYQHPPTLNESAPKTYKSGSSNWWALHCYCILFQHLVLQHSVRRFAFCQQQEEEMERQRIHEYNLWCCKLT